MPEGLRVIAPGVASTLQDAGRPGYLRYGISGSGAMDPDLLALANGLVGNPFDAAVIEMAMVGPTLVCEAETCRVALAGAPFAMALGGRILDPFTACDLRRGDRLTLGAPRHGLRAYLAVAGGFAVAPMLGSVSTHTRTRLGGLAGEALAAGDLLPLRAPVPAGRPLTLPLVHRPRLGGPIRVVLGPQADGFTPEGIHTFLSAPYTLSARADRMGCHLDGPAIAHADGFNIVSDGIVNGSIQVPGHGRPLILLADRHTTGGYPKIATVISADFGRLAQVRPGEAIRFEAVSVEAAQALAREARRALAAQLAALVPAGGGDLDSGFLLACNLVGGVVSATACEPAA
ncbi:biotin-dependent carboxyltransferase family protein [Methylobacterium sp. E-065]|uniref:5-oxoprolinase subunit C family protein n=1 Tax=Methylobacterium sp. E-065 TaxID=2836583 RepID=UPI001FBA067B|nr:biotin-dependent carboxyltransferase family protein [Methylobacterium sp. E-065]MCJ2020654.1 biotin-dependent carboxyltransferase family protein [Methylobacterium sp. E-065]